MEAKRLRKLSFNLLKILVSLGLLYLVFRKIPFNEISTLWNGINPVWLAAAAALFLASQLLSTVRLGYFFYANDFHLSFRSNLELYFLGMFYNFFIPGGIGGDAYKIYLLKRKFGWNPKKLTSAVFNDRLSGLIAICLLICLLAAILLKQYLLPFIFLAAVGLIAGYSIVKKLFPGFSKIYFKSLLLSITVQLLQVCCFILLLKSIGVNENFPVYALLFLASSVLSLISFAGIGVREMLFLQASKYFQFNPHFSVSASLLFTLITAFFSLFGLYFQIRKVNLTLTESHEIPQE